MKGLFCAVGSLHPSSRILGIFWILLGSSAIGDDRKIFYLKEFSTTGTWTTQKSWASVSGS